MCLRLLDANLNRVQVALRVIEDVLRFEYSKKDFRQIKTLRHHFSELAFELREKISGLIDSRDVDSDPGKADMSGAYKNAFSVLYANLQRAKEGLRAIEEALRLLEKVEYANSASEMRFLIYSLEKEIFAKIERETR